MEKSWVWIIVAAVIVAGGILFAGLREPADPVALRVNDATYTEAEIEQIADQLAQEYAMYQIEISDEEIMDQAIDRAIQEALILELAEEREIEATREEIDEEFNQLMAMYGAQTEEDFLQQLSEMLGIETREEVEEILIFQIKLDKVIASFEGEVDVTDEDVREAYDEYREQVEGQEGFEETGQEVPSFEDMEGEVRTALTEEAVTPLLIQKLEEMESEADIEILMEITGEEVDPADEFEIDVIDEEIEDEQIEIDMEGDLEE